MALCAGCGRVWRGTYIGILVPSVDRVGRYFPLTVVARLEPEDCLLAVACASRGWFEAAEHLVLDALDAEALDFDTFDEQIALLRERLDTASAAEAAQALRLLENAPPQGGRWQMPLASAASLQNVVNAYAQREVGRLLAPLAIWWTGRLQHAGGELAMLAGGLPEPAGFVGMLTGDWSGTDWASAGGSS